MSRINQLLPSSFKSIPFFVRSESLNAYGQKRISHDYPNSSVRYEEAQGVSPVTITVDIFFSGEDFRDQFELFRLACENQDPGILSIPTLGVFENIVARPASATATQESVGEITTTVVFSETIERPSPQAGLASQQEVASNANNVVQEIEVVF